MAKNSKITDMTVGSPLRHILVFAVPLLIGNVFQQLYNMVDSVIVGKFVSADALAAVGTCGSMNFLFFSLSSGFAIGIGIIVAQYFGAGDERNVRSSIANSIYVLGITAITVSIAGFFVCPFILKLLHCPNNIYPAAVTYMRTTCCGIIFIAFYNGIASILRALGDSRTPLYFLILSSVINLGLDLLFVLVFKKGVFGVALATIISQAVSAVSSMIYAWHKIPYFKLSKQEMEPHSKIIASSFKLGVPMALQSSLIAVSMMMLQGVVNTFGPVVMAAYTIVMRIEQLIQQPFGSLGQAVTNYSGQNRGAGNLDRVRQGFKIATLIVTVFCIVVIPVVFFFGKYIVGLFIDGTKDPQVLEIGSMAMKITCAFYFFLGMIYVPRAVLNGCGDSGFAMINGITEVVCRILFSQLLTRVVAVKLFNHEIPIGFWGIWITTGLTWMFTSFVCLIRYKTGKWKTKGVV